MRREDVVEKKEKVELEILFEMMMDGHQILRELVLCHSPS